MPLYDLKCSGCGKEFEGFAKIADRHKIKCPDCNSLTEILPSAPHKDWFKPGYWNDFDLKPIWIKNRKHLESTCRKYGCYSKVLGRGYNISEI